MAPFVFQQYSPRPRVEPHNDVSLPGRQRVVQLGRCAVHRENGCHWNVLPRPSLWVTSLQDGDTPSGHAGCGVERAGPLDPQGAHPTAHVVRHGEGVKTLAIRCRPIVVGNQVDLPAQQGMAKLAERHCLEFHPLDAEPFRYRTDNLAVHTGELTVRTHDIERGVFGYATDDERACSAAEQS